MAQALMEHFVPQEQTNPLIEGRMQQYSAPYSLESMQGLTNSQISYMYITQLDRAPPTAAHMQSSFELRNRK